MRGGEGKRSAGTTGLLTSISGSSWYSYEYSYHGNKIKCPRVNNTNFSHALMLSRCQAYYAILRYTSCWNVGNDAVLC